jgi:hypothetical protein
VEIKQLKDIDRARLFLDKMVISHKVEGLPIINLTDQECMKLAENYPYPWTLIREWFKCKCSFNKKQYEDLIQRQNRMFREYIEQSERLIWWIWNHREEKEKIIAIELSLKKILRDYVDLSDSLQAYNL